MKIKNILLLDIFLKLLQLKCQVSMKNASLIKFEVNQVDPEFFKTTAMVNDKWKKVDFEKQHVLPDVLATRFSLLVMQKPIISCFFPQENCVSKLCNSKISQYHLPSCEQCQLTFP